MIECYVSLKCLSVSVFDCLETTISLGVCLTIKLGSTSLEFCRISLVRCKSCHGSISVTIQLGTSV